MGGAGEAHGCEDQVGEDEDGPDAAEEEEVGLGGGVGGPVVGVEGPGVDDWMGVSGVQGMGGKGGEGKGGGKWRYRRL